MYIELNHGYRLKVVSIRDGIAYVEAGDKKGSMPLDKDGNVLNGKEIVGRLVED